MRNLYNVLGEILEQVPPEEQDLIASLKSIRSSAICAAPEWMFRHWREVGDSFSYYIGEPKLEWHFKVAEIFKGNHEDN